MYVPNILQLNIFYKCLVHSYSLTPTSISINDKCTDGIPSNNSNVAIIHSAIDMIIFSSCIHTQVCFETMILRFTIE